MREPLSSSETRAVIERTAAPGTPVPLVLHKWWGDGLAARYGAQLDAVSGDIPDDILAVRYIAPGEHLSTLAGPSYRWGYRDDYEATPTHSIGRHHVLLPDWSELDRFLDDLPDPLEPGNFAPVEAAADPTDRRYRLAHFWRLFHERFWSIRGMENLMLDYYDAPDELQRLGEALLGFYKVIVDRYADAGYHGILTSDDLGHQTGPMMSPEVFRSLYLPLYREFAGHVHSHGMHFFLHSCGDNTLLMDMLIEAGVDVFHPVQAGTMDYEATRERFGSRLSFLVGFDVQHLIVEGTPEEIGAAVERIVRCFGRSRGLLLAAGNGILPDTPLANIRAMLTSMAEARL